MANYYCPKCSSKLSEESGCGSVSYFCNTCKTLVSRQKMLNEERKNQKNEEK